MRFPAEAAQFIFDGKAREAAQEEGVHLEAQGATIISFGCAEYPERLKEIYDSPPVLWVRGVVSLLSRQRSRWWVKGILLPLAHAWRKCWRGTWQYGGC